MASGPLSVRKPVSGAAAGPGPKTSSILRDDPSVPAPSGRPSHAEVRPGRRSPWKLESPTANVTWPAAGRAPDQALQPAYLTGVPGREQRPVRPVAAARLDTRHQVVVDDADRPVEQPVVQQGNGGDPRGQHGQRTGSAVGPADPGEDVDPGTQVVVSVTAGADGVAPVDRGEPA